MLKAILKLNTMSIDKAKVILTPNGYKAGKLYAIKPVDGSGDLTVNRNTSATRVNPSGLIESVGNNVPRLDYTGSDCPKLLVEPQRTNLVLESENFNLWWQQNNINLVDNSIISPEGNLNATKLVDINTDSSHVLRFGGNFVSTGTSGDKTFTFFVKKQELTKIGVVDIRYLSGLEVEFDLQNLDIGRTFGYLYRDSKIEKYLNGWLKCTVIYSGSEQTSLSLHLLNENYTSDLKIRDYSYIGNGSGLHLWGVQLEQGSTPTSYIPTTSSTVTRNQDVLSKDYSSIIEPTYSVLLDVEGNNARLKIEDANTGFDLPLEGSGKIVMVVDNEITFHFPDNGQANTTVTYEKPADLRNWEIVAKLGAVGVRIASIENQVISQTRINNWVSGNVTSDWLQDYSTQTDFVEEFRALPNPYEYFPVIDLSSGVNFFQTWRSNLIKNFPFLNISNGLDFTSAWRFGTIVNFPANMFDNNNTGNYKFAFQGNNLNQTSVDNILVSIEKSAQLNNITGGILRIDAGTNATPSATGQAAADSLRNTFGWTVNLNGY